MASADRMAAHLGVCDDCESRLESVSQQADLIVGLLRAADPFESCSVESRNLSRESTKPHHPVDKKKPSANPADNPESLPEKIDKYFVLDWIARGGFGNVYKAKDPETNRIVAIKVPRLHLQESTEQFLKEACTAAQLDHPSIVQVYDWGRQEDGACFVVMQYIEGHTLRSVLESPSDHAHATNWVVEIAEALHYAHSQNVYHRDVKPENILLDKNDKPYLTDFGLAIREDERWDYEGEEAGTCVYMSPEQVRRESQFIDGRTDIWSLGVVLYELLTRQKPYSARTRRELFEDIEHRNPRPPRSIDDSVSPELETVCLKCLKTRVEDRYLTAGDLSRDLRSCLPNDQIASLPLHRRRGFTAALVSVGMLIVACFAIYFWPEDPAELGFLNEHPKVIAFNSTNPLNFFNPQIDDGRLTVRSFADICIFSYGPLLGDSFTARVNMIVEPDKSSAGFFWGLQSIASDDEADLQRCIAVFVNVAQTDRRQCDVRVEVLTLQKLKNGLYDSRKRERLAHGSIADFKSQKFELEIRVQSSEIQHITIDGVHVTLEPKRVKFDSLTKQPTEFGLIGFGGTITFFDSKLLTSKEN